MGSRSRRWLNQSTYSRVAYSTWSRLRHGPLLRISSVLYNPITDSARALSYESPTDPTDGEIPVSTRRSVYRIDRKLGAGVANGEPDARRVWGHGPIGPCSNASSTRIGAEGGRYPPMRL